MSTLYSVQIKKLEVTPKPIDQIVNFAYHSSQDNFRHRLKNCGLDLSKEPHKIRTPRLLELLMEIKNTQGVDALKKLQVFHWDQYNKDWEALRKSYIGGSDLLHSYGSIVRNNLFYTILEEDKKVLPVMMTSVEIISVHPDAGYPRFYRNPAETKECERKFLLRILADSIYSSTPESLLVKESQKPTKWDKTKAGTDYRMNSAKIIWGFERHKGMKIKPRSSKSFWKKHEDKWWSDLKETYFEQKSNNKPYELVTYDIMIHPGWQQDLGKMLNQPYESSAHWS